MPTFNNLVGQHFGDLTVIKYIGKDSLGKSMWLCQCKCGNITKVRGDGLTTGNSKKCGNCKLNKFNIIGDIAIGLTSSGQSFIFDSDESLKPLKIPTT